jgi:hypothetical protein
LAATTALAKKSAASFYRKSWPLKMNALKVARYFLL